MKKIIFCALALWVMLEAAHQFYTAQLHQINGHFNWGFYAYNRNKRSINQLYNVSVNQLPKHLFVETRNGLIRDSTGSIPLPIRGLILKLAKDIEPEGHFYYDFTPNRTTVSIPITIRCPTPLPNPHSNACSCLDWVRLSDSEGVIFNLSISQNRRLSAYNGWEYVRSKDSSFSHALAANQCFFTVADDGYLRIEKMEQFAFPIAYNSRDWDLLISRLF